MDDTIPLKLAEKFSERNDPKNWIMSEKLDGIRCFWTGKALFTRDGTQLAVPGYFVRGFPTSPLDGELYLGRGRYSELVNILLNKQRKPEDWLALTFVVFDSPTLNIPFKQRVEAMERVFNVTESNFIKLHKFEVCPGQAEMYAKLEELTSQGKN